MKNVVALYTHSKVKIPNNIRDNGERLFYAMIRHLTSLYPIEKAPIKYDIEKDIDFAVANNSFSVKTYYKLYQYPYIPFEKELRNSETGQTIKGNFEKCQAKWYVLVCPEPLKDNLSTGYIYIVKTRDIKDLIANTPNIKISQNLSSEAKATNKTRYFDDAVNYLVPKELIFKMAVKKVPFEAIDESIANFYPTNLF